MKRTINLTVTAFAILLCVLALTPAGLLAQSLNGSMYAAQGASVPVFFNFSVSGQTFIATILTFFTGGTAADSPRSAPLHDQGLEAFLSLSSGASCACSRDGDLPGH